MSVLAAALRVIVGADTTDAERGLKSFSNKLNNTAKSMGIAGGILTAGITMPLLGIATNALSMAADFEQSMNILQQVTGASADTMAAMNAQALSLGATTVFSAGQAADAMLELGKAGMDTEQIMAAIPGVMALAAAGGVELSTAAGLTAASLNAFHLQASEAGRVADLLAAGANASSASIADLGQGLQQAGFAFANANQPIENLVASLAILTNVGLTGSDAGTALKNAFMRMMNPTQEAADLIAQMGISFYDATGTMKQLPAIIDMLNVALAGMTNEQRDAALSTLFMSDGMKAMIPLLELGSEGFNKMVAEVTKTGAATDVANARMKGLAGGLEYLKGSVDSFLIGAAQPFLGGLNSIVLGAADALTAFGALPAPIILATEAFLGGAAALGPVLLVLSGLAFALASPLLPIALLVIGVVALGAAWATNVGGIRDATAAAFTPVAAWFTSTLAGAQTLAAGITAAFANTKFPSLAALWTQFKAGDFQTIASTIRNTAYTLMVNLNTELDISSKVGQVKINAGKIRDDLFNGLSSAIDGIDFAGGGKTFAGMIADLTAAVNGLDFSGIDWVTTLQTGIVAPLGAAITALQWVFGSDSFAGLTTAVQGAFAEIPWGDIAASAGGLATTISSKIGEIFSSIKMPELPKITFLGVFSGAADMITSMTDAINNQDWASVGANFVTTIGSSIKSAFTTSGKFLVDAATLTVGLDQAFNGWLLTASANLSASMGAWLATTAADITTAFDASGLSTAFTGLATALDTALSGFLTGARASIASAFLLMFTSLGDTVSSSWSSFTFDLPTLDWATFIPSPLEWGSFVADVVWSAFVPGVSWSDFVALINWGTFVESIGWGSFIPSVNWANFIPFFGGGGAAAPSTGGGGGGGFGGGSGFDSSGSIGGNAAGTSFWRGGISLVGERGSELVDLPRGSRVYSHRDTMDMLGAGGGGGTTVNVYATVNSAIDLESMANRVARVIGRKTR